MKLGIMQPYFFPYLGYFDLLRNTDIFIIYDTVQYIKQGWLNRNRILHPNKCGWQYISIPVNRASFSNSYRTPILDVEVTNSKPWKQHLLGQLIHYERTAPYAEETIKFVSECLLTTDEKSLSRLNVHILACCANLLNLNFQYQFCSDIGVELDMEHNAEERILDLCKFFGAGEYMNLPGGVDLYHPEIFETRNIKLTFRNLPTFIYPTSSYAFEPNLSIIDILMWNTPEEIKNYLDAYRDEK
jgi:hypothetical protein